MNSVIYQIVLLANALKGMISITDTAAPWIKATKPHKEGQHRNLCGVCDTAVSDIEE
jgi:hypothetical protein